MSSVKDSSEFPKSVLFQTFMCRSPSLFSWAFLSLSLFC
jgi:hypothetical protein